MKATKYFRKSMDMALYAKAFKEEGKDHWYIKTTLRCDHVINQNRRAMVLVNNETIVQRLITCRICNVHGNSQEIHQQLKTR